MTDTDTDSLRAPLEDWLTATLPGATAVTLHAFDRPGSGFSAETIVLDAEVTTTGGTERQRLVLRKQSPEPPVYPVQVPGWRIEVALQYEIMSALGRGPMCRWPRWSASKPIRTSSARPSSSCATSPGRVPVESPPYTQEGFFLDASPAERTALITNGLATMAKVHAFDWRAAGLDWFDRPRDHPRTGNTARGVGALRRRRARRTGRTR